MWPQIVLICFFVFSLAITMVKHGEPKGEYSLITFGISAALELLILWAGGFFDVLNK